MRLLRTNGPSRGATGGAHHRRAGPGLDGPAAKIELSLRTCREDSRAGRVNEAEGATDEVGGGVARE